MGGSETRSEFVTVVAWIFIVLTGFSTVILLFQNVMFRTMFSGGMGRSMTQNMGGAPPFARLMFGHADTLLLAVLLVSLLGLITSIALLKRKNWARLLFIAFMILGVLWNLGGIAFQFLVFPDMSQFHNADVPPQFTYMMGTIRLMTSLVAIAFAVLFLWIVKRLMSRAVREEFRRS